MTVSRFRLANPAPRVTARHVSPGGIGIAIDEAAAALAAAGFDEPRRQARRLLAAALGCSPGELFAHPERRLDETGRARVAELLRRRLAHEPLSRITGRREFWGHEFALSPEVLDPRPDSETLIEAVLARLPDRSQGWRFLDLGTGSGCLLLALLSEFPRASGIGIDIAPGAAATARRNADGLGLGERAHFVAGDWAEAIGGRFDVVVANPPYIPTATLADLPPEVRDYDPPRALDGGSDGLLAYRAIAASLPRLLLSGGLFVGEIGQGQAAPVAAVITGYGLAIDGFADDLAGITRCVIARL